MTGLEHETMINNNYASVDSRIAAERRARWAVVYGLVPQKDGDMWCVLSSRNQMEGISGFGTTPEKAIEAFDLAMASNRGDAEVE